MGFWNRLKHEPLGRRIDSKCSDIVIDVMKGCEMITYKTYFTTQHQTEGRILFGLRSIRTGIKEALHESH